MVKKLPLSCDEKDLIGGDEGVLYHFRFNPPSELEPITHLKEGSDFISFEAEEFDSNVPLGGTRWEPQAIETASGKISLEALPVSGRDIKDNFITFDSTKDAPKLDYRINFPEAGIWYIWVLGRGYNDNNSVHVGLFDKEVPSAKSIRAGTGSVDEFSWTANKGTGTPAYAEILKKGINGEFWINIIWRGWC